MRKFAKAVLGVAILSGVVLAQPTKPVTTKSVKTHETRAQERFVRVKTRILHMIDKRMGFLAKHKLCVERAQNWKELRACKPHRKMWHKPIRKWKRK